MMERKIECPECGSAVIEKWEVEGHGIKDQSAFCLCGWGGSYPFQRRNPYTGKFAWEK